MVSVSRLIFLLFVGLFAFNVNAQSYPDELDARIDCLEQLILLNSHLDGYSDRFPSRVLQDTQDVFDCSAPLDPSMDTRSGGHYFYAAKVCATAIHTTNNNEYNFCVQTNGSTFPQDPSTWYSSQSYRYIFTFAGEPEEPCQDLNSFTTTTQRPPAFAQMVCISGCVYDTALNIDIYSGSYGVDGKVPYTFTPTGNECTNEPDPEPYDKPPTDTPDLDIDDYADAGPDPGDGETGASGGGSCDSPPQCKGDSLQCNMLYQTWSTRCAVANLDGGIGEEGLGDSIDGLADAVSGLGGELGQIGSGIDGIRSDMRDAWDGEPGPGGDGDYTSLTGTINLSVDDLDQSGLGFSRACPFTENPSFSFLGDIYTIDIVGTGICDIFSWVGNLLVALFSYFGVLTLLRGR